ncbi:response regulator [Paenibacillus sp. CF384]|uniref:response regulator transcription factor n=1 Tax=Paenibacillus sp. CF384 TaxID=1884382 RepID=UPI00089AB55A|nr:response regulator [Paenibacillus sp. CF384]SDX61941.1 two-component system, response regulator YesN [Paenibacillus sp. CF384]
MIRAILVDDEHIVRKGLIHILPWQKHGMEVAADFEGGEKALAWMEHEQVDLLVTDLSMPGMSGFELMRIVKERFPHTETAILTCHQDFQYVQDALRLGAIDYIVKTELDDEKLDRLFGRIAERLLADREERSSRTQPPAPASAQSSVTLLLALKGDCKVQELYAQPGLNDKPLVALQGNAWFTEELAFQPEGEAQAGLSNRWAVFCMHQVGVKDRSRLKSVLDTYIKRHSFYVMATTESAAAVHDSMQDVLLWETKPVREDWMKGWRSFDWLFQDEAFHTFLEQIADQRPDPNKLCGIIHQTVWAWRSMLRWSERDELLQELGGLQTWAQWQNFLQRLRRSLRAILEQSGIDKDITTRMIQSIEWSLLHLDEGITQEEAAAEVHLSRGYFSDCFKRTTGATYNDFMRMLRMDQAKRLLLHSSQAIQEIAAKCGFADESYFRKLFRQETGRSPRAYREEEAAFDAFMHWPPVGK